MRPQGVDVEDPTSPFDPNCGTKLNELSSSEVRSGKDPIGAFTQMRVLLGRRSPSQQPRAVAQTPVAQGRPHTPRFRDESPGDYRPASSATFSNRLTVSSADKEAS